MKIHHVRLNIAQVRELCRNPEWLWQVSTHPILDGVGLFRFDDRFENLCRVLFGKEKAEQLPELALIALAMEKSRTDERRVAGLRRDPTAAFTIDDDCLFSPATVKTLASELRKFSSEDMNLNLEGSFREAEYASIPGNASWTVGEARSALRDLQRFYVSAAAYGQYVLTLCA